MATTNKPKVKKVAVKTVLKNAQRDINDAKECKALLATVFKKAEKEWIPTITSAEAKAKELYRRALDISVEDENGMMEVEVSSDEGEDVSVVDNTQTPESSQEPGMEEPPTEEPPVEEPPAEEPAKADEFTKAFKLVQQSLDKISKQLEGKTKEKNTK